MSSYSPPMLNILTSWATPRSQNVANTCPPLCLAQGDTPLSTLTPSQPYPVNPSPQDPFFPPMPTLLSQQLDVISNFCKSPRTREGVWEGGMEENFLYHFLKWGKLQGRIYLLVCQFPLGEKKKLLEGECYVLTHFYTPHRI